MNIIIGLIIWYLIGCVVLAAIDENEELFEWAKSGKGFYFLLVVMFFPIVVYKYFYR